MIMKQALLSLTCTGCGHPVHTSFTDTPGCSVLIEADRKIPCQCERATICGDDILALVREFKEIDVNLDLSELVISTPADLLKFHEYCAKRGQKLMGLKNHDYAGYSAQQGTIDVMKNFRAHEEYGIVVRMGDKLKRLENFALGGKLLVEDESIFDTAIDLMNYAILFLAFGRERRTQLLRGMSGTTELPRHLSNSLAASAVTTKIYVVHDTLTRGYLKLNEDGCLPNSWGQAWLRRPGNLAMLRSNDELPAGYVVIAEMPITAATSQIQFGVGNS
jgi:hypothetical protein